jgi:hypothetical protein
MSLELHPIDLDTANVVIQITALPYCGLALSCKFIIQSALCIILPALLEVVVTLFTSLKVCDR